MARLPMFTRKADPATLATDGGASEGDAPMMHGDDDTGTDESDGDYAVCPDCGCVFDDETGEKAPPDVAKRLAGESAGER